MDWLLVVLFLVFSIYVAFVIKNEKSSYLDESYLVHFEKLSFPIPRWWSITKQTDHSLHFERTDTRYDWRAEFTFIQAHENRPLHDLMGDFLEKEEIYYDQDDVVIETHLGHLFKSPETQNYFSEMVRVEGKATEKITERIYLDLVFAKPKSHDGYFIFMSKSSVLNGLLEGPYFEECLKLTEIKPVV